MPADSDRLLDLPTTHARMSVHCPLMRPRTRRPSTYAIRLSDEEEARWREAAEQEQSTVAGLVRKAMDRLLVDLARERRWYEAGPRP